MSFFKSALVACVMSTTAMVLGFLAPAAINEVHAQAVPFPPCVNDYRAEIAAGQRSPHYPRCVDDHGIPGRFMSTPPQYATLPGNCPSGQVYSGGACVTIQNQGGMCPSGQVLQGLVNGVATCVNLGGGGGGGGDAWKQCPPDTFGGLPYMVPIWQPCYVPDSGSR